MHIRKELQHLSVCHFHTTGITDQAERRTKQVSEENVLSRVSQTTKIFLHQLMLQYGILCEDKTHLSIRVHLPKKYKWLCFHPMLQS